MPTTITPTTFGDGGLGSRSLRDAVLQFNADTGTEDDTIQLLPGTYSLTIQNVGGRHETAGLTGDLNLTQTSHRWIIQGAGPTTIIDASQLQDRVFQIVNAGMQVVFQDLVIQGGLAQDNGADGALAGTTDALGGGVLNNGGDVTLDNVVVQNNGAHGGHAPVPTANGYSANGGGVYSSGGALTLAGATIANNQATGGVGGYSSRTLYPAGNGGSASGAGLYASGGSLDISDSSVSNNRATGGQGGDGQMYCTYTSFGMNCYYLGGRGGGALGGGLYVNGGSLTVASSTIASNQAAGGPRGLNGYVGNGFGGGLYIVSNTRPMTVSNSTLSGNSANGEVGDGGGLYNYNGMLTVSNSTLSDNSAVGSGGIFNGGTLAVSNSTLSDNSAVECCGGGISNGGTLTVSNSTLSGNSAGDGGGIYNDSGRLTVSNSILSANSARSGGGIYNQFGTLTVTDSTLSGNSGGGIENYFGALTVSNSTLSGNSGSGISSTGTLTVSNSTLSGNSGSGISTAGTLTVSNSTLSGNSSSGIQTSGTVALTNVTVTANRANSGGGLYVISGSPVLHSTLIAGNFRGATGTTRDDVHGALNASGDYNLIGDGTGMSGLHDGVNGNQVGSAGAPIDPLLGPLQDNGGPTLTHALLPSSPAIDAGNNAYATDWDQRGPGYPRIVNGIIDIGAFEYQGDGSAPSTSRSSRAEEAGLAQLVAGLPRAVSHAVMQSPALSPGHTSTITDEGLFVPPLQASSDLLAAPVDPYFATVFEDRGEHTTAGWGDLEPAAIGWLPVFAPDGAAVGRI